MSACATFEEIRNAIVSACEPCGGKGGIETTGYGHACGGDDRLCAIQCPVPEQVWEQCEYCGRPVSAVEALFASKEAK